MAKKADAIGGFEGIPDGQMRAWTAAAAAQPATPKGVCDAVSGIDDRIIDVTLQEMRRPDCAPHVEIEILVDMEGHAGAEKYWGERARQVAVMAMPAGVGYTIAVNFTSCAMPEDAVIRLDDPVSESFEERVRRKVRELYGE